jgi:Matrixin
MHHRFIPIVLILLFISCKKEETKVYSVCNNFLTCNGSDTDEYCTFGYKWGSGNPFSNAGANKPGPSIGPVELTYTFVDAGYVFSTHSQENLTSRSYSNLPACSKDTIRHALFRWQAITAITFTEQNDPASNIRIIMGDITQGGVSFPPFPDKPCSDLAGQVAINFNPNRSCENLYFIALHEIGHALGLGHVQSNNVMNPNKVYSNLQAGDIKGIQSIYGLK